MNSRPRCDSKPSEDRRRYLVVFIFVGNLKGVHGSDHGLNGGEYVLVNQLGEPFLVLLGVARTVNDSHLLDEGALATLARPYSEQRFKGFNRCRECCTRKNKNTHTHTKVRSSQDAWKTAAAANGEKKRKGKQRATFKNKPYT